MPGPTPGHLRDTRPEKAVQRDVAAFLRALGYHVSDLSQPRATCQTEGLPDLYAMRAPFPGAESDVPNALWVEVKTSRGTLRPSQARWHAEAEAAGVPVVVARSAADLLPTLRALGAPIE